jgi:hypothetical protein
LRLLFRDTARKWKLMKLTKSISQISFGFFLVCCLFSSNLQAQKNSEIKVRADNCETIASKLHVAGSRFEEVGNKESYLIIIGGAAEKENSRYNTRRISDAVKFFVKYQSLSSQRIVFGIGPSIGKLGYLKFYINAQLIEEIETSGTRLCHGSGDPI